MSEYSPMSKNPDVPAPYDNISTFELPEDENALDPTKLTDADIVDGFMAHASHFLRARSSNQVAGIINSLLGHSTDVDSSNKTRLSWHHETLVRITQAEQRVSENETYEDPIVVEIVAKLKASLLDADNLKDERLALRHLIDLRTIVLANQDAFIDYNDEQWTQLIDKLYR